MIKVILKEKNARGDHMEQIYEKGADTDTNVFGQKSILVIQNEEEKAIAEWDWDEVHHWEKG